MKLILLPNAASSTLTDIYHRALKDSTELYIVSAYLTHWDIDVPLGSQCKTFRLIVGKDFGITRKNACVNVMRWMEKTRLGQFLVADDIDGFHPKAMFWREISGATYALVGSSNLSRAAFTSNYEVNSFSKIKEQEFKAAKEWIKQLVDRSVVVSESWLEQYVEAVQPARERSKGNKTSTSVVELPLPLPDDAAKLMKMLERRREQMSRFRQGRGALEDLFRAAAKRKAASWDPTDDARFYDDLNKLWTFPNGYRFQGAGWERQGKSSDFRELSRSVVQVLDSGDFERDDLVASEIDRLAGLKVTTRKALFSEMLCQFFPEEFPVLNRPVTTWLQSTEFAAPARATEGVRYVDLARKLRMALRHTPNHPAKNLAEIDAVIWLATNGGNDGT